MSWANLVCGTTEPFFHLTQYLGGIDVGLNDLQSGVDVRLSVGVSVWWPAQIKQH